MTRLGSYNAFLDQPPRELRDALDLVGDGAELFVEGDVREFLRVLGQRLLLVLLAEEARVGQASGENLAVARNDLHAAIERADVRGADEAVGELAVRLVHDEIFRLEEPPSD